MNTGWGSYNKIGIRVGIFLALCLVTLLTMNVGDESYSTEDLATEVCCDRALILPYRDGYRMTMQKFMGR